MVRPFDILSLIKTNACDHVNKQGVNGQQDETKLFEVHSGWGRRGGVYFKDILKDQQAGNFLFAVLLYMLPVPCSKLFMQPWASCKN